MKIAVVINAERVLPSLSNEIVEAERKYDLDLDVFIKPPKEIPTLLQTLKTGTYNAFVIGGGDGTVRGACEILKDSDTPLAIIPLGTFNMLANDLGYTNDIDKIFSIVKNNKIKKIDIAEVNGNYFINHSWIGFYSKILAIRKKYKSFLGTNKLLKIIFMAFNLFKPVPTYQLEIILKDDVIKCKTCLIYIGNNDQHLNFLNFGDKKVLTSGLLSINILNCKNRWELFKCALSITLNRFKQSKYLSHFMTNQITITGKRNFTSIVIDGDLIQLAMPLHYSIHQKILTVFTP